MNDIVSAFMSLLHKEYLKPRGYTKKGFVFSRSMDGYTERVRLKGSPWNHPERPWSFGIDFGVEIIGVPSTNREFPHTHTHAALERIVKDASGSYALRHNPSLTLAAQVMDRLDPSRQQVRIPDQTQLLGEIADHIEQASAIVFAVSAAVERHCLSGEFIDRHLAIVNALEEIVLGETIERAAS